MSKKLNPYYDDNNACRDNISDNLSILNIK